MSPPAATVTDAPPNIDDVKIFTAAAGDPVFLRDLWDQNEGMAVVALLRHFGCPFCWELAAKLKEAKPRLDSAGVKLIAIGVGTPEKARLLAERLPFPMDSLYADPECKSYDALGLYRGVRRTFFSPTTVFSRFGALREALKNYTFKAMPDDKSSVWQQVFVHEPLPALGSSYIFSISSMLAQIASSYVARVGCLCSKGNNCYMVTKIKPLVTMLPWMTSLTFAAKFLPIKLAFMDKRPMTFRAVPQFIQ